MLELKQVWPEQYALRYREKGYWRGETMFGFLAQRTRETPDHIAVIGGGQRWTYAGLLERANENAARFLALGLRPGERVVVQLPNIPEFLSVVFALFRANQFVRFWLTSTPALPDTALAAAQTKGRERYEGFVEALGRRLARRRRLADEVSQDVAAVGGGQRSDPAGVGTPGDSSPA
ncbi:AMP-binding protein [Bradyrhizobium barranii subsp. apii]|uniref:AMP-binding protein n=1 Tax=Bradyrhizobium barranii subsp. apii TaxID=2819348 RepID=A0A8T5VDG5_9BRAD|nr:AMP-binding protein [Bradyrhizobium barranii]UPT84638.1 AMP-binding protein [Bradyrhizobium barranii subsp. apii]UPT93226.1 AMP-binding protein [Bradyrhizobium barranii subsp. apii]